MDNKLHILQHSLGLDQYGHGNQYRNHFATGPGSDDFDACTEMVGMGLMKDFGTCSFTGDMHCFVVTPAGIDYVALNSPERPPEPKRTASQKRYQDYMDSDCGLTFAEWIGVQTKIETHYGTGEIRFTNGKTGWEKIAGPPAKTIKEAKAGYKAVLRERRYQPCA